MDSTEEIDRIVAARLERQEIVTSQAAPFPWYVLDESVLRRVVGGPAVMGHQLDRLLDAADSPGIVVQTLPFTARQSRRRGWADLRARLRRLTERVLYGVLWRRNDS